MQIHLSPFKNQKVQSKLSEFVALSDKEQYLLYYDDTMFNISTSGLVLTTVKLIHFNKRKVVFSIPLRDIETVDFKKVSNFHVLSLSAGGHHFKISIVLGSTKIEVSACQYIKTQIEESKIKTPLEERWSEEERAAVPETTRLLFESIEKDECREPGPYLVDLMKKADNPFIRARACLLLEEKMPQQLFNIAAEGLCDKDSRVREAAAQALANSPHLRAFTGYPTFQRLLLRAKDDADERVRYWARRCVSRM